MLTDEEREQANKIGTENIDYCMFAILYNRYPDIEFKYDEENGIMKFPDKNFKIRFGENPNNEVYNNMSNIEKIERNVDLIEKVFEFQNVINKISKQ